MRIISDKKKEQNSDEYIRDLTEWMEHQYDPGYWTNHIPPHIKYAKKPSRLIVLLLSVITIVFSLLYIFSKIKSNFSASLMGLVFLFIGIIVFFSNFKLKEKGPK